ncbi:MAG TPA: hypothetical protein VLW75_03570 [Rhizomicrobium sp.]|nr:hypothetical protein [Rhizomicrobium sp.]
MAGTTSHNEDRSLARHMAPPTPAESARYTKELLDSLRAIALRQDQHVLAGLLDAAAREAKRLLANSF